MAPKQKKTIQPIAGQPIAGQPIAGQPITSAGRGEKKKRVTLSKKTGLVFPVARILNKLKRGKYSNRVRKGAGIYMASVLEYLSAEVLELAGNEAKDIRKKTIKPHHIQLAVRRDGELEKVFKDVIIPEGGVLAHIHNFLLPKQKVSKK